MSETFSVALRYGYFLACALRFTALLLPVQPSVCLLSSPEWLPAITHIQNGSQNFSLKAMYSSGLDLQWFHRCWHGSAGIRKGDDADDRNRSLPHSVKNRKSSTRKPARNSASLSSSQSTKKEIVA